MNKFVVLWSPHQNVFHVETLSEMIEHNLEIFANQEKADFIVLAITETQEEADKKCNSFKDIRNSRIA